MDWQAIFWEIIQGGSKTVMMIVIILLPLMIGIELVKDAKLLDKAVSVIQPVMKVFTLPKEGAFPLLAGIFFGITYGSGVILPFAKDGSLTKRDMMLICIFLAICHGMIEDPLIYAAIGAKWWVVVVTRVSLAVITMLVISRVLKNKQLPVEDREEPCGKEADDK